jgi:putative membrane protein
MKLLGKILINVIALFTVAYITPGFKFENLEALIVASIVIGVVNTFIRPILQIIALPISILTLGVFAFLINVTLLWFTSFIVPGFHIESFPVAALASITLSLVTAFLHNITKEKNNY